MKKERKKETEKYVCNQYLIGASIQKMQGISQLNNQKTDDPTEKQAKTWTDTHSSKENIQLANGHMGKKKIIAPQAV